jgi:hypothetical protein
MVQWASCPLCGRPCAGWKPKPPLLSMVQRASCPLWCRHSGGDRPCAGWKPTPPMLPMVQWASCPLFGLEGVVAPGWRLVRVHVRHRSRRPGPMAPARVQRFAPHVTLSERSESNGSPPRSDGPCHGATVVCSGWGSDRLNVSWQSGVRIGHGCRPRFSVSATGPVSDRTVPEYSVPRSVVSVCSRAEPSGRNTSLPTVWRLRLPMLGMG